MMLRLEFALLAAALAITGCAPSAYRDSTMEVPGYGNAVHQNSAVMIIDPLPASAANTVLNLDGLVDALARERYRQHKVIPPRELSTTNAL
jgi:hypothetical protein